MSPENKIQLNGREEKVVAIARQSVKLFLNGGKKPKQILIKVEESVEVVNIKNIAQVLHLEGISLDGYRFSQTHKGHVFRPLPYEETKEKPSKPNFDFDNMMNDISGFDDFFGK